MIVDTWRTISNYAKSQLILALIYALWSLLPLIGWGSFRKSPTDNNCIIDWSDSHQSNVSYLTSTFLVFFLIPICTCSAFYYTIYEYLRRIADSSTAEDNGIDQSAVTVINLRCDWSPQNHFGKVGDKFGKSIAFVQFQLSVVCLFVCSITYCGYGIVYLRAYNVDDFQCFLTVIMPKFGALFNPIIYVGYA